MLLSTLRMSQQLLYIASANVYVTIRINNAISRRQSNADIIFQSCMCIVHRRRVYDPQMRLHNRPTECKPSVTRMRKRSDTANGSSSSAWLTQHKDTTPFFIGRTSGRPDNSRTFMSMAVISLVECVSSCCEG